MEYQKSIDLRQEHWAATQATNYLDFMADLSIDRDPRTIRNSGLICTIGNSSKVEVSTKFYYIFNFFFLDLLSLNVSIIIFSAEVLIPF